MTYQQVTSIKSLGSGDRVKIKSPFKIPRRQRCVKRIAAGYVQAFVNDNVVIELDKPDPRDGSKLRMFSALMVSKGYISVKQ